MWPFTVIQETSISMVSVFCGISNYIFFVFGTVVHVVFLTCYNVLPQSDWVRLPWANCISKGQSFAESRKRQGKRGGWGRWERGRGEDSHPIPTQRWSGTEADRGKATPSQRSSPVIDPDFDHSVRPGDMAETEDEYREQVPQNKHLNISNPPQNLDLWSRLLLFVFNLNINMLVFTLSFKSLKGSSQ